MGSTQHLILTVDYELFGNGSGSLQHCVTTPLDRMAAIAEGHGATLEIFVEALEFQAIEHSTLQRHAMAAVKSQLADMVRRGHSLQLHLHPQWNEATWSDGAWSLNERQWRTGDIGARALTPMLHTALEWIQLAAEPAKSDYRCAVFRAGGWCIQPSKETLAALRAMNMSMDSSVAPGVHSSDAVSWYDFRRCPAAHWWRVDDDVCRAGNGEFLEVPIAVGRVNPLRHVQARLQRSKEGEFCGGCIGTYRSRRSGVSRYLDLLHKVWNSRLAMLDFCALPADLLTDIVDDWARRSTAAHVPVVAIGHTKNFSTAAERAFDAFLTWASTRSDLRFSSYDVWQQHAVTHPVKS